ncbi:hypothetical protein B0H34DRAFT_482555 [Crassisporium funariophilum]|nr:hypothetical protein B0H34DRAFT_482555 [Crassisporium funariophilum]
MKWYVMVEEKVIHRRNPKSEERKTHILFLHTHSVEQDSQKFMGILLCEIQILVVLLPKRTQNESTNRISISKNRSTHTSNSKEPKCHHRSPPRNKQRTHFGLITSLLRCSCISQALYITVRNTSPIGIVLTQGCSYGPPRLCPFVSCGDRLDTIGVLAVRCTSGGMGWKCTRSERRRVAISCGYQLKLV